MINPCGNDGDNEFVSFTTGSSSVNIADLAFGVTNDASDASFNYFWGGSNTSSADYGCVGITSASTTYGFLEPGTDDAIIASLVNELNTVAGCSPDLFTAAPATIPAGSNVVVFLGAGDADGFDDVATNLDFSGSCGESYYAVFGAGTSGSGYFSNSNSRLSTLDFGGGCDCVAQFQYTPSGGEAGWVFNGESYSGDNVDCLPVSVIMPVGLINLSAKFLDNGVILNWQTSFETNHSHFEIEKSNDGKSFDKIGEVQLEEKKIQGNKEYQYIDDSPYEEINYYRLKQVDIDGRYEYSHIISVIHHYDKGMVYNDLSSKTLQIVEFENQDMIRIYDLGGVLIFETNMSSNLEIDYSTWSSGLYIVHINGSNQFSQKIVIP
jgi:hypothetical protein